MEVEIAPGCVGLMDGVVAVASCLIVDVGAAAIAAELGSLSLRGCGLHCSDNRDNHATMTATIAGPKQLLDLANY
jgi:hypothetical protein